MNRAIMRNGGSERISHFIKRRPAVNIHHAERYSRFLGLPLNRFVTINFSHTGCPSKSATHVFRKLLTQRFSPWLRRSRDVKRPIPPTYVWVLECGGGQTAVHWLVHVPRDIERLFDQRIKGWLDALLDESADEQAVNIKAIFNLTGLKRYLLKGIDPVWAKHLAVNPVDQGIVIGKRSGFSKNLGPAARKRGGYKPRKLWRLP